MGLHLLAQSLELATEALRRLTGIKVTVNLDKVLGLRLALAVQVDCEEHFITNLGFSPMLLVQENIIGESHLLQIRAANEAITIAHVEAHDYTSVLAQFHLLIRLASHLTIWTFSLQRNGRVFIATVAWPLDRRRSALSRAALEGPALPFHLVSTGVELRWVELWPLAPIIPLTAKSPPTSFAVPATFAVPRPSTKASFAIPTASFAIPAAFATTNGHKIIRLWLVVHVETDREGDHGTRAKVAKLSAVEENVVAEDGVQLLALYEAEACLRIKRLDDALASAFQQRLGGWICEVWD